MGQYFFLDTFLQGLSAGILISLTAGWGVWGVREVLRAWHNIAK